MSFSRCEALSNIPSSVGCLDLNFGSTFLKNRFLSVDVMLRGGGASGDNVHLKLCVEKSICESSLSSSTYSMNKQ